MGSPVVTIQKNGQVLKSLTLESGEALLGRGEGCVIRLDDRAVSRQHAVIKSGPSGLMIEKKSHLAPLRVNGAECDSAVLKEGDEVLIGPYILRIDIPSDRAEATGERSSVAVSQAVPPSATAVLRAVPDLSADMASGEGSQEPVFDANLPFGSSDLADPMASADAGALVPVDGLPQKSLHSEREPAPAPKKLELKPEELSSLIEEDAKTRILPQGAIVRLKLKFSPGAASIEIQEFDQEEVSIGRGRGCDVVLNDKKASRKHLIIRRQGVGVDTVFSIRDLESANGVFVNGARISEHVLSGDDIVRVGDTEFLVQAVLPNFDKQSEEFLRVDHNLPIHESSDVLQGMARVGEALPEGAQIPAVASNPATSGGGVANPSLSNIGGIAGITGNAPVSGGSLFDRYKALPQRTKLLSILAIGVAIYSFLPDDQPKPRQKKGSEQGQVALKNKGAKDATAPKEGTLQTFEQLTPELQKFVESQYNLSLEYFRNRDFDKSLYEVRKIFQYVSDYRDARDLERYCVESKNRLQAQEEERRRKEVEQANKARVAKLVIEVEGHMARKEYVQAREIFAEIVALEPDNTQVAGWKKEIEAYEEAQERERQLKKFEAESLEKAREILASGNQAIRERKWAKAIEIFKTVFALEIKSDQLVRQAQSGISRAKAGVAAARDPLIAEAERLEQELNYAEAFRKYSKARDVDPSSKVALEGMSRTRAYLKDRSKQDDTSMSDVINQIVRRTKEPPIDPIPVWSVKNGVNVYGDGSAPL
ncbi:FHA domain-containing protein, partial [bacterium]|nr:FHA domain-containing protein [bacterium]